MKLLNCLLIIVFSLVFISPATAQTIHPENWAPTWVNPSWERPANMTPDARISLPGDLSTDQLTKPAICGGCHSEIFEQWSGGVHANALNDPIFQAATKLFLSEVQTEGDLEEARGCVRCHTPFGHLTKEIETTEADYDNFTFDESQNGVFCDFCHSVKSSAGVGNAPFIVDTEEGTESERIKWGPWDDAVSPYHDTAYSDLHTRSEMCGMCHDVTHTLNGVPLERTYTEWREGPYNTGDPETTVYCQDCHMRQLPGYPSTGSTERPDNPGVSAPGGKERDHIYTHYHIGGNAVLPALPDLLEGGEENVQMVYERLQNCAALEIITPNTPTVWQTATIQVKVSNIGAGHYLPTGLSEVREVWLEVVVKGALGKTLFQSGKIEEGEDLDSQARIFNIKLADKEGKHTVNVAKADHILSDHRIPPKGYITEDFSFFVPLSGILGYTVEARLRYRSASQSLIDALLGEDTITLPIIDMVSATTDVTY